MARVGARVRGRALRKVAARSKSRSRAGCRRRSVLIRVEAVAQAGLSWADAVHRKTSQVSGLTYRSGTSTRGSLRDFALCVASFGPAQTAIRYPSSIVRTDR